MYTNACFLFEITDKICPCHNYFGHDCDYHIESIDPNIYFLVFFGLTWTTAYYLFPSFLRHLLSLLLFCYP